MKPRRDSRWWLASDDAEMARMVVKQAHSVSERTQARQQRMRDMERLYGDDTEESEPTHKLNLLANAVDSLVAEVTQTQPRAMAVATGGDWFDRQRAEMLTAHWDVMFHDAGMRTLGPLAVRDAILHNRGFIRPYEERGKVCFERIWPGNVLVDDRACIDCMPRVLYLRRYVDRYYLAELYPDAADAIENAHASDSNDPGRYDDDEQDTLEVIEAWHLPSCEVDDETGEHDGVHVIAIEQAMLCREEWKRQTFPLASVTAIAPPKGWWGPALAQRGRAYQEEHDRVTYSIRKQLRRMAHMKIFCPRGAGVPEQHFNDEDGAILYFDGPAPPEYPPVPQIGPELFAYQKDLESGLFNVLGISQLSAQSLKPKGLDSGVALDAYNDTQSRRFVNLERSFEELFVTLAREALAIERQLAEGQGEDERGYEVSYKLDGVTESVPFAELDIDDDKLGIQVYPASAFPTTPAGRLKFLKEMLDGGAIDLRTFWEEMGSADFKNARQRFTGPAELIDRRLSLILRKGPSAFVPPEPYMDTKLAIARARDAIQRAECDEAPPERIDLLRTWLTKAEEMQAAATPPPALPMMPPGGAGLPPEVAPPMPPMSGPPPGMPPMMPPAIGNA